MTYYDAENHILRQKEMARRAAETYLLISHLDYDDNRARSSYRRAMAGVGGKLITLGHRLQGEIDQLAASPDLGEPYSFSSNGNAGR